MSLTNRRKFLTATGLASITALGTGVSAKANSFSAKPKKSLIDVDDIPIIDNHNHESEFDAMHSPDPLIFASNFYHGSKDDGYPVEGSSGASAKVNYHISQTGIVLAAVAELSQLFNCEDTLKAVTAERYRRVNADAVGYAKMLYKKANIEGIVLDSKGVESKDLATLMPNKLWKLVPNDFIFAESLKSSDTLAKFRSNYIEGIANKLKDKDYIAVKCHIGERSGLAVEEMALSDSLAAYDKARKGDAEAVRKIYVQAFNDLAHYCCEKEVPIHIHTGSTGGLLNQPLGQILDPFLLTPYLMRPELVRLKLVLLHGGHPWIQHTALMTYYFPNVYLDMSCIFPWNVLGPSNYLNDFLSIAPISKIFYGSGSHVGPEIAYLAAVTAKKAISATLTEYVDKKLLTVRQVNDAAHMILHRNVKDFHNLV